MQSTSVTCKAVMAALLLVNTGFKAQQHRRNLPGRELILGMGTTNYLGDVGGGAGKGKQLSPFDVNVQSTRMAMMAALRTYRSNSSSWKILFQYATVAGNDRFTSDPFRNSRNLHFRTRIAEAGAQYETGFHHQQRGERYLRNVRGIKNVDHYYYALAGLSLIYFNPQAMFEDQWHNLQPLGTEGQGLNGSRRYRRFTLAIPLGTGLRVKLDRYQSIGVEVTYRFTFTDYLDDVSGTYHDANELARMNGSLAAHFASPGKKTESYSPQHGEQRGNPSHNDGYLMITIHYMVGLSSRR